MPRTGYKSVAATAAAKYEVKTRNGRLASVGIAVEANRPLRSKLYLILIRSCA